MLKHAKGHSFSSIMQFILHLPNFIRLAFRLLGDPRVPIHLKLVCYASYLYLIFPLDIIKDTAVLMLGAGVIDDVLILFFAHRYLIQNAPPEIVQEHVDDIAGKPAQG